MLTYTVQGVRKLLVYTNWSCQTPTRRAVERDDDAVAGRVEKAALRGGPAGLPVTRRSRLGQACGPGRKGSAVTHALTLPSDGRGRPRAGAGDTAGDAAVRAAFGGPGRAETAGIHELVLPDPDPPGRRTRRDDDAVAGRVEKAALRGGPAGLPVTRRSRLGQACGPGRKGSAVTH
ncbi:winged helix-turn-helix domain-containing protein, partial [Streptomyces sp. PU-14G]|uniref:winged helix-turn-helix domain-containing protein n=1 Tax=Streptomyces sp. PU-14G TaxID=2800808 RepID=UPI0034DEED9E